MVGSNKWKKISSSVMDSPFKVLRIEEAFDSRNLSPSTALDPRNVSKLRSIFWYCGNTWYFLHKILLNTCEVVGKWQFS